MIKQITYIHLGEGDVGIAPATGVIDGVHVLGVSFNTITKHEIGLTTGEPPTQEEYMMSPVVIQATKIESINALIDALNVAKSNYLLEE